MPLVATPPQSYASTAEGVPCFSCADTAHVPSPAATGYRNRRTRESEVAGPGPVSARRRLSLRGAFEGKQLSRDRRCRQSDRTGEHSSRARAHFRGRAPAKRTCLHPVCRKAPVLCVNLCFRPALATAPPGYASSLARRLFCTRIASNGQLSLQHQQVRHLS